MAATPSNRIKLTPSNSPFLPRPSRAPVRPRAPNDSCLSLQRVIGTTCSSPTGFDTVHSSFAYIAGGAVVVVDVSGEHYSQRFYRARPTAVPLLAVSPASNTSSTPNSTPKANDSRNRVAASPRDSLYAASSTADYPDSPTSKTWTSRERIKAATCLALSRDGRYLAVGETGYAPRVLIFNLQDASSDVPLVSISEHTFGVNAVAWSPDTKYLASLGSANDGFLYLWKVDPRTGAVKLFQQNRCTAYVRGMVWMGSTLLTFGVRHVKVWRVEEGPEISPTKQKFSDGPASTTGALAQKPLAGRNILLGSMLDATFCCVLPVSDDKAIICSETGSVCLLDDGSKQMKLTKVLDLGFSVTCISSRGENVYVGGKDGQFAVMCLESILTGSSEPVVSSSKMTAGLTAMGHLAENLVTIDSKRSIDIWSPDHMPGSSANDTGHIRIPVLGDPIAGIQRLSTPNKLGGSFFTWSGPGRVTVWSLDGVAKSSFDIPIEQSDTAAEAEPANQVVVARATGDGSLFMAGDKRGVLRIVEASTRKCLLETKVHSSNCQDIAVYEGTSRFLVASCGRDRTVQLFNRSSAGVFEHFQTLEFSAKVVQVLIPTEDKILTCSLDRTLQIHELVSKEGEPDVMAAIPFRNVSLRASPSSMAVTPEEKTIFVALLDRSVCQFDVASGRLLTSFKCNDEGNLDSVVLESLTYGQFAPADLSFLLGISNTDKSVRVYDTQSGSFMDREWGHTEAINGVVLIGAAETGQQQRAVSVGEDGTIMIWALDFQDPNSGSRSRDPSPEKTPQPASARPPLRKVLSKAELAEFQRPSTATTPTVAASSVTTTPTSGRRSPPRPVQRRPSRFHLPLSSLRTPTASDKQTSNNSPTSTSAILDDHNNNNSNNTPSRRASSGAGSRSDDSPPPAVSPKSIMSNRSARAMFRRPSLPALGATPPSASSNGGGGGVKSRKGSHHRYHHHHHHYQKGNNGGNGGGGSGGGGGGGGGGGSVGNGSGSGGGGYPFGSLGMATEQTCRQLRAYRKKLASVPDALHGDVLAQLDAELRLTAAALGERAIRSRIGDAGGGQGGGNNKGEEDNNTGSAGGGGGGGNSGEGGTIGGGVSETMLSGLLDAYSERLVSMLDEKLRLRLTKEEKEALLRERPRTSAGEGCSSSSSSASSLTAVSARSSERGSVASARSASICEEPESA